MALKFTDYQKKTLNRVINPLLQLTKKEKRISFVKNFLVKSLQHPFFRSLAYILEIMNTFKQFILENLTNFIKRRKRSLRGLLPKLEKNKYPLLAFIRRNAHISEDSLLGFNGP